MRIHIQNPTDPHGQPVTREEWEDAADRAGLAGSAHLVTVGDDQAAFAAAAPDMEALVCASRDVAHLFPAAAPRLRVIFCTSAGLDPVPFDALPPGVQVLNNRGVHGPKAGEYGIMAILMLANHIPGFVTSQRAGKWQRQLSSVIEGRRLTVVGLGSLGGAVAEQAQRFGLRVTGVRARMQPHPACERVVLTEALDHLLPQTDYLVLACPLTDQTRNLLTRRRLSLLPPHAGVVNIGRGGLVDQDALCDALDAGRLGGAVLDVFTPEPIPENHRLWSTRNLVITPHVSADDHLAYNARSMDVFINNLRALERGEALPNLFDRVRGY